VSDTVLAMLLNNGIEIFIMIFMVVILPWVIKKLNVSIDNDVRAYVETALRGGLTYALQAIMKRDNLSPTDAARRMSGNSETKTEALRIASNYVLEAVPDGLKRLGVDTTDQLHSLLSARLGEAALAAEGGTAF